MTALRQGEHFPVRVQFHSDWICGTGVGRYGSYDKSVERDHDGLPIVRGGALTALLRDAAETVVRGLDEGESGVWHRWLVRLFGSQPGREGDETGQAPRPSSLVSPPLRLPGPLRKEIIRHGIADATVVVRAGVRINHQTGVASDDTLRVEQRARAGLALTADWTLTIPGASQGDVSWPAELLLRAAASQVTAIGGKRRRGAGRCEVTIGDGGQDRLNELLDKLGETDAETPEPPELVKNSTDAAPLGQRGDQPLKHRHDLRITVHSPVVINRGLRGNVVLTEKFIPGTALLALVARALRERATRLITAGELVITDATIEIDGKRSVPTPLSLRVGKTHPDGPLINTLFHEPGGKTVDPPAYCLEQEDALIVGEPDLIEAIHAAINDEKQRPTEDDGLYVNEGISTGTVLRAQIWAAQDIDITSLDGKQSVGRSKKDDYGHIEVRVLPASESVVSPPPADQGKLVVWLQSDVVLRGENGQPDPTARLLGKLLAERLGVKLVPADDGYRLGVRRIESWQTRWGLPRPSLLALRAGGVASFTVDGVISAKAWRSVLAEGIGERRAEGFGRVSFQADFLGHESVRHRPAGPGKAQRSDDDKAELGPTVATFVRLLRYSWRDRIRDAVLALGASTERRSKLVPPQVSNSQLGALRTLADRLLAESVARAATPPSEAKTAINNWLRATTSIPRRRDQWTELVLTQLSKLVNEPDSVWDLLEMGENRPPSAIDLSVEAIAWTLIEATRVQTRQAQSSSRQRNGGGA
ncbi:MAG TPA: RAMP superfamily CRISPR-associated protein [Pseudonocardiaceae bacterium]